MLDKFKCCAACHEAYDNGTALDEVYSPGKKHVLHHCCGADIPKADKDLNKMFEKLIEQEILWRRAAMGG